MFIRIHRHHCTDQLLWGSLYRHESRDVLESPHALSAPAVYIRLSHRGHATFIFTQSPKRTRSFSPDVFFSIHSRDQQIAMALNVIQKDQDSPKLFIGHIPRHFSEVDVRPMLEEFGELAELAILRDKLTQASRCMPPRRPISIPYAIPGCGFVSYKHKTNALAAIAALHETRTLPGAPNPFCIKIADSG